MGTDEEIPPDVAKYLKMMANGVPDKLSKVVKKRETVSPNTKLFAKTLLAMQGSEPSKTVLKAIPVLTDLVEEGYIEQHFDENGVAIFSTTRKEYDRNILTVSAENGRAGFRSGVNPRRRKKEFDKRRKAKSNGAMALGQKFLPFYDSFDHKLQPGEDEHNGLFWCDRCNKIAWQRMLFLPGIWIRVCKECEKETMIPDI